MTEDTIQLEIFFPQIAAELSIQPQQVKAASDLLEEGSTVPFIARYRKEATGSLDEVAILAVRDRLHQLKELEARRAAIMKSLVERELITPELEAKVKSCQTMSALEDVYLPFKPKRRTKGTMAKERGLEPLAKLIWEQDPAIDPMAEAAAYVNEEKEVPDLDAALLGARHIMAEWINEDAELRAAMRELYIEKAVFTSKVIEGQEEDGAKFKDYFDWSEPAKSAPSHRVLAMRRGEKEGHLILRVQPEEEPALRLIAARVVKNDSPAGGQVLAAGQDSYKRLLGPAMETEVRMVTKKQADAEAVKVFAANLRELLLAAPLGQKRVLALDPGYRTGCKLAVMDAQGALLHHDVIHIMSAKQREDSMIKLNKLFEEYQVEAVSIGNGTASRETEALLRGMDLKMPVVVVNESGASIYSASKEARDEFPDLDLTVRGAVSIGRRLMDPLAELVKIDPKSIGVGQYQHDVDQNALKNSLDDVVVSCVNAVGVEVNTASPQLLSRVSGLGPSLATGIVVLREQKGPFNSRDELMKVPRLGPKAYEQAAGFLRIRDGKNPLDASAVHPESYPVVEAMAKDLECTIEELLSRQGIRKRIQPENYVSETVGLPTITDILAELEKPGRDPRQAFEEFSFAEGVHEMEDLEAGMKLPGVVTNVTNFGAFVDVGVHQDGLVHISQLADHFVKDPHQVVKVHDRVQVTVLDVDMARRRISLSMRTERPPRREPQSASAHEENRRGARPAGKRNAKTKRPAQDTKPQQANQKPNFNNPFADALKGLKID